MILINGCSFCSLPGQWQDYFDLEHKNLAKPGNNNESIFHDTVEELTKNQENYDCCIIIWTFLDRYLIATDYNEEISLYPNLNKNVQLNTVEYEKQLLDFKKILYSYFHSDVLQQKRLASYKKSINSLFKGNLIHLDVLDFFTERTIFDETGHLSKESSIEFAKKIKKIIKENSRLKNE